MIHVMAHFANYTVTVTVTVTMTVTDTMTVIVTVAMIVTLTVTAVIREQTLSVPKRLDGISPPHHRALPRNGVPMHRRSRQRR